MARIRSIHPGQWTDEDFLSLSPLARLLCLALRNEAHDDGVFDWKPITLKMRCMPVDNVDVAALLEEIEAANQVRRFEHKGRQYGAIRKFTKWQRPKKPNSSGVLPDELRTFVSGDDGSSELDCAEGDEGSEFAAQRERRGGEGRGKEEEPAATSAQARPPEPPPPNVEDDIVRTPEARAVCDAVQADASTLSGWWTVDAEVAKWLMAGCDLQADILPTVRGVMKRRTDGGKGPPNNPSYFANAVMEAKARRLRPATDGQRGQAAPADGGADVQAGSEVAGELRTWASLVHGLDPKVKARIRAEVPAGRAGAPKAEALMAELGIQRSHLGSRHLPDHLRSQP